MKETTGFQVPQVADRIARLPSQFFAGLSGRVAARVKAGHDVINLGQGNPDLPTPEFIVQEMQRAVADPRTHGYSPFRGLQEFRQAAADFYAREYGVNVNPDTEVAVLFGGKAGLVELGELYLNPGDKALVPNPGYPDYWSGMALSGAEMLPFPLTEENGFLPNLDAIPDEHWAEAKLMFLNYPNNPTGAVATLDFFENAAQKAANYGTIIVHDFAYGAIGFDGVKPPSFLQTSLGKTVGIEIYTLSKTFNMAGWRLAFAVGNPDVIAAINTLQDHYYVSVFAAVQRAGIVALQDTSGSGKVLSDTYERRRNAFVDELTQRGVRCIKPGGSFFVWLPVPQPFSSSVEFADHLLLNADVAVAPGVGFGDGGEGYVRVGMLTTEERLREAARRIAEATSSSARS